uniref:Glycosyltransferase n=1 Tax=Fundidesulfovibrio putealis TaxID=270496 RepID=A0A7C4EJJ0_9BACT
MADALRVAVPALGGPDWMAGVSLVANLARANALLPPDERLELHLAVFPHARGSLALHGPVAEHFAGVLLVEDTAPLDPGEHGPVARLPAAPCPRPLDVLERVHALFPMDANADWGFYVGRRAVVWVPDVQHRLLPHFFSVQERARRDGLYARVARDAPLAVFSTRAARDDFAACFPDNRASLRVLPHHSVPGPEFSQPLDADALRARYALPERFLLCCNQFWIHKDHACLLRALARLRDAGSPTLLALTGHPDDCRFPGHYTDMLRLARDLGLENLARFLGLVPRADQLGLMRLAAAVVQPSLFEGWSTSLDEARLLGRPQVLSDIPAHREHAVDGALYFPPGDDAALARALEEVLKGGREEAPEVALDATLERGRQRALADARTLAALLREAVEDLFPAWGA